MPTRRPLRARLWRFFLRLRFVLWQRRRHQSVVLETGLGRPLLVLPDVFNPTLFRTTPFVLDCLDRGLVREGSRVLDLGTGTGVLALAAASRAAQVVAVDINPAAVRCARINALLNHLDDRIAVIEGDLFEAVTGERFDVVLVNPPYYRGEATTPFEQALLAGDFPQRLAGGLAAHLEPDGEALVVLSSDGEEQTFRRCFQEAGLIVEAVCFRDLISERATLYRIKL